MYFTIEWSSVQVRKTERQNVCACERWKKRMCEREQQMKVTEKKD